MDLFLRKRLGIETDGLVAASSCSCYRFIPSQKVENRQVNCAIEITGADTRPALYPHGGKSAWPCPRMVLYHHFTYYLYLQRQTLC